MSVLTLNAVMKLDSSKFMSGLSNAQKNFSTAGKSIAAISATVASGVAAIGTAAIAAGKKIYSMVSDVAAAGDEIEKNSQKVGLSYEAYQKWDYAMQIAGTDMASCTNGLKTLTNKFDDAINGSSSAAETFERLGLSMEDIQGLSREDLFATVVSRLQNVTDETEKAALANDLFGKSGQNLIPLFNTSEEELADLMAEAEEYGMVMSDEAVDASAEFADALTKLKGTANGVKNALVGQLLPGVTKIIGGLSDLINGSEDAGEAIKEGATETINTIVGLIPQVSNILSPIAQTIIEQAPVIISGLITAFSTALPGVISSITTMLSTALPQIVPQAITLLGQVLTSIVQLSAEFLPPLLTMLLTTIANELPNLIQTILPALVQMIQVLLEALPGLITTLVPILVNVVIMLLDTLLTQVLPVILENLVPILDAILTALFDNLPVLLEGIINALITGLPILLDGILNVIMQLTDMIMNGDGLSEFINAIFTLIEKLGEKAPEFTAQLIGILFNILVQLTTLIIASHVEMFKRLVELVTGALRTAGKLLAPVGNWVSEHVITPVVNFFQTALNNIKNFFAPFAKWVDDNVLQPVKNFFTTAWNNIKVMVSGVWTAIKIILQPFASWIQTTIIAPVTNFFSNMWNRLKEGASNAWAGIKNVFSTVANFFQSTFQNAWNKVKQVFSAGGAIFQGIASGIYESFKNIVNSLISGINSVISVPFNKINSAIKTIKNVNIAGVYPFYGLSTFSVPSIPYLAKGGLITSPMYAMIGEQGTEAVIPLERDTKALDLIADRLKNDQDLSPIVEAIKQMKIYLDSGVLVGAVSDQMDTAFGIRQVQVSRGVTV